MPSRLLVVNADDFGASPHTNRGILQCHAQGILTSTSLMVRGPAALEAPAAAANHPALGFGLHVDLGEWVYQNGEWAARYQVVDQSNPAAVEREIEQQLDRFRQIMGTDPTHIDSHQHVHREGPAATVVQALGKQLGVPVRLFTADVQYIGDFYGQSGKGHPWPEGISVEALLKIMRGLSSGKSEMGCHPGLDEQLASTYRSERLVEVASLCDPRVKAVIAEEQIELVSFAAMRQR